MSQIEQRLDVDEVADLLKVAKQTIYGWIHEGRIPYEKVGRLVRFSPSRIESWLEKGAKAGRATRRVDV